MLKLLIDNNISHRIVARIEDLFPNSTHVMLKNLDKSSDLKVWNYAKQHNFTILTKDSDFNDIAIHKGTPPKIIWLKMGNCKIATIENILRENKNLIIDFLNDKNSSILEI